MHETINIAAYEKDTIADEMHQAAYDPYHKISPAKVLIKHVCKVKHWKITWLKALTKLTLALSKFP